MGRRDLRYDWHTASLLTDPVVITPKYRRKILVGDAHAGYRGAYQEDMQGDGC